MSASAALDRPAPRLHHPAPLSPGAIVTLTEGAHRHLLALRRSPGEPLTLFCGDGSESAAELSAIDRRQAQARVLGTAAVDRESPLPVVLAQGVCAGDRMDWVVQKATELGVVAIQPLLVERTVVRLPGERRQRREQHWQNVAIAACEQCGRNRIPEVRSSLDLGAFLAAAPPAGPRLLLSPAARLRLGEVPELRARAAAGSAPPGAPEAATIILAVGPEGGFAPAERALLEAHRFVPVRLGPRILRTETAPVAALAVLQSLCGDL